MALFIGSNPKSDSWGEDYVLEKCIEYFDSSCVIYRNREVFGTQFDICILIPNQGIAVIEVKAWKAESIIRVENGDSIVIRTETGAEEHYNPTKQARGYVFSMKNKIRQKTGMVPFVFPMVCFPLISEDEYYASHIEPVCEYETTILKEDLSSKASFYKKLNLSMLNGKRALPHTKSFTPEFMLQVRQIFESVIQVMEPEHHISKQDSSPSHPSEHYSLFYYIPSEEPLHSDFVCSVCNAYIHGTKLILIVRTSEQLTQLAAAIDQAVKHLGIVRNDGNFEVDISDEKVPVPDIKECATVFEAFNCLICVDAESTHPAMPFFCVADGQIPDSQVRKNLITLGAHSAFNYEQYVVEHAGADKHIETCAGAGTGKTHTMISRIAFLCFTQNCSVQEMANRIVMITFTNEATDQMKQKLKTYFKNYYLLTGNVEYLRFITCIDNMQISTIHSYTKRLISLLGQELGYGFEPKIRSSEYARKQVVADELDIYLRKQMDLHGKDYITKLGYPVYAIRDNILTFIKNLHDKSINAAYLKPEDFGTLTSGGIAEHELHQLFAALIPLIEQRYSAQLREENSVHLSSMMSMLNRCLSIDSNVERLKQLQTGTPQFMFIDEFQDTDDNQIAALQQIAELLQYKLFVVGDIKQCVYRFRGAQEKAFDRLHIGHQSGQWLHFSLNKNFRTDARLLELFHESFSRWGRICRDGEPLLVYNEKQDRLIGTRRYNTGCADSYFYRPIHVKQESERMEHLFREINWQISRIRRDEGLGKKVSTKEKEIAILVRDNWQANLIRNEGKRRKLTIVTNTGGDLYRSEPALDMLTLANAMLHYDEADYLYALTASHLIGGGVNKAHMYQIRREQKNSWRTEKKVTDTAQARELQHLINCKLARAELTWNGVIKSLRMEPVMQVMRKVYSALKPWSNYGGQDTWKQNYYRQNVDLLFEELMTTVNLDSLTINSLVDILLANVQSCKNVDSRIPALESDGITVRCITIHKAKGLEYGAVILPYCSYPISQMKREALHISVTEKDGQYKVGYRLKTTSNTVLQNNFFDVHAEEKEREREEMRILYVAMTRAIRSFSWLILENRDTVSWQKMIWEAEADGL